MHEPVPLPDLPGPPAEDGGPGGHGGGAWTSDTFCQLPVDRGSWTSWTTSTLTETQQLRSPQQILKEIQVPAELPPAAWAWPT